MKTSKDNDKRFIQDVLLRQIFQEISDENRENSHSTLINDSITTTPEKTSSKRGTFLKWPFIIIFIIGIIYLWFYTLTEVIQDKEVQTKSHNYSPPKIDQEVQQKEMAKLPDVLEEEPKNTHTVEETGSIELIVKTPPETEDPKTEREKAKEVLLLQMQN